MLKENKFLAGECHLETSAVVTYSYFCHPSQCLQMRLLLKFFTFLKKIGTQESTKKHLELNIEILNKLDSYD